MVQPGTLQIDKVEPQAASALPEWVVCPKCRSGLRQIEDGARCLGCGQVYGREHGFLSLLADPEDRFEDERLEDRELLEERSNTYSTLNYTLPLLRQLFGRKPLVPGSQAQPRILSMGCGVGVDVDLYADHGFDAYGADCGERVHSWTRRRHPERFYIANAKQMPFADASFDFVTTGCLLPHIGVEGDTTQVTPDAWEQRAQAARELTRVVRPAGGPGAGGILLASPNRRCPLDLWHLQDNPDGLVRWHSRDDDFLLAVDDYRRLFVDVAGCQAVDVLPITGYWGFLQKSQHPWQKFLALGMAAYFRALSTDRLAPLRATALNPWLIVLVRK